MYAFSKKYFKLMNKNKSTVWLIKLWFFLRFSRLQNPKVFWDFNFFLILNGKYRSESRM